MVEVQRGECWLGLGLVILYNCQGMIRYDTRCYFNVRSKADINPLNLPHGTDNKKV